MLKRCKNYLRKYAIGTEEDLTNRDAINAESERPKYKWKQYLGLSLVGALLGLNSSCVMTLGYKPLGKKDMEAYTKHENIYKWNPLKYIILYPMRKASGLVGEEVPFDESAQFNNGTIIGAAAAVINGMSKRGGGHGGIGPAPIAPPDDAEDVKNPGREQRRPQ